MECQLDVVGPWDECYTLVFLAMQAVYSNLQCYFARES